MQQAGRRAGRRLWALRPGMERVPEGNRYRELLEAVTRGELKVEQELDDTWDLEGLHTDLQTFWPTELTVEQLAGMYGDGGEIERWSQLRVKLDELRAEFSDYGLDFVINFDAAEVVEEAAQGRRLTEASRDAAVELAVAALTAALCIRPRG